MRPVAAKQDPESFADIPPDFCVEIAILMNPRAELHEKIVDSFKFGVHMIEEARMAIHRGELGRETNSLSSRKLGLGLRSLGRPLNLAAFAMIIITGQALATPPAPFTGKELPLPPQQKAPWTAPKSGLPETFVSATELLFEIGLSDPRGCEYREISVAVGSVWSGEAGTSKTHGWILPGDGKEQRFAVCWNGLVYPVIDVGKKADVTADVNAAIKTESDRIDKYEAEHGRYSRYRPATPESSSIAISTILPLRASLLLRLGEVNLAEQMWDVWRRGTPENVNNNSIELKDPFLMLATDWSWSLFDRAICAHMRGDDKLALLSARALVPMNEAVDAAAEKRGFERRQNDKREPQPYLDFIEQLPKLVADQERRAALVKVAQLPAGSSDQAKRIASLIRDLENVAARQWGQPGGVTLADDPIVLELIREGDAAVEPLLDVLENDKRLTRTVSFHRDFFRYRTIHSVRSAANEALSSILKISISDLFEKNETRSVDKIRTYWNGVKDAPLTDRWFLMLADDKASANQWIQAMGNIVQRTNVETSQLSAGLSWTTVKPLKKGEAPPMRGDSLRKKLNPTLTELLAKRIEETRTAKDGLRNACTLAEHLALWDPSASLPALAQLCRDCREQLTAMPANSFGRLANQLASLTLLRIKHGDQNAVAEYAKWIVDYEPNGSDDLASLFVPLWRNPDHPDVRVAAQSVFSENDSVWVDSLITQRGRFGELLTTPALGLRAVRDRVLRELANKEDAGVLEVKSEAAATLNMTKPTISMGFSYSVKHDPLAPKIPFKSAFRVGDYYAWRLSQQNNGAPRFEIYWPIELRDKTISAMADYLVKYGDRLKYAPDAMNADEVWWSGERARMSFPRRTQPATADDVAQVDAIFHLNDLGKPRVAPLPSFPIKARWTTQHKYPYSQRYHDTKSGKSGEWTEYHQEGHVWQAEEVDIDGKPRRFYGFVGCHYIGKIPAEEIEFPEESWTWAQLSRGLDCNVDLPWNVHREREFAVGTPLPLKVRFRNRSGLDQKIPEEIVRMENGSLQLHAGIELRAFFTAEPQRRSERADEDSLWKEMVQRDIGRFVAKTTRPIGAAATSGEFAIDLQSLFDLSRAGRYRVELRFTQDNGGFAAGESRSISFSLSSK